MAPPKDEPPLALEEIQGNVVPGFLKDHRHFVFFTITDASVARKCLSKMNSSLSTSAAVLKKHEEWKAERARLGREPERGNYAFLNVALSASGLRKVTSTKDVDEFEDKAFKAGLAKRSGLIGDPESKTESGHVSGWVVGGFDHPVDGVLILASDKLSLLEEQQKKVVKEISSQGMTVVHEDRGDVYSAPSSGHEQFGFKDGISQPAIRGRSPKPPYDFVSERKFPTDKTFDNVRADFAKPGSRLVWPGHFLFGYGRQKTDTPRTYDPANEPKGPSWAKNGSFMVYRRLRQNPDEFWKFVEKTSKALAKTYAKDAPDKKRLAALMIGRWDTGTPVVRSPDTDIGIAGDAMNYFGFGTKSAPPLPGDSAPNMADPDGLLCPLTAHIRKVNPRDQTTDLGLVERNLTTLFLRRGITYAAKADDKGLLFVSHQSSVENQFEFVMKQWVNKADLPREGAGKDPILTHGPQTFFNLPIKGKVEKISISSAFVIPTGGEYFFSPSISFFKNTLANLTKK